MLPLLNASDAAGKARAAQVLLSCTGEGLGRFAHSCVGALLRAGATETLARVAVPRGKYPAAARVFASVFLLLVVLGVQSPDVESGFDGEFQQQQQILARQGMLLTMDSCRMLSGACVSLTCLI